MQKKNDRFFFQNQIYTIKKEWYLGRMEDGISTLKMLTGKPIT